MIKSIRREDGIGHRFEDKYMVGFPDMLLIPYPGPVFFAEVKLLKGNLLTVTPMQEHRLQELRRPSVRGVFYNHAVVLGWSETRGALYIGDPGAHIDKCRYIPRPSRLQSADWEITDLLFKYNFDKQKALCYNEPVAETGSPT